MRMTSKGQVTIPRAIRDRFGFLPGAEVEFVAVDGVITLVKAETARLDQADRALAALEGSAGAGMTTDEIMTLTRG
ncbi:AbrB/MazE/SpoVT family DNA-binding domain-containing protein [Blastococcus capsensis]|uniref:AbrB/MazE/SpoVT family DNA-binding domain-containing protein n=1 Tax=Blastococcus capsensis TaxID=1564163 RepID=UPI0025421738|nr:AbrB/MazE/SpoVT family DNA-binding domain-containing protein [Blastococcus capsensis]MDK3255958.1 AbrB/MazE/SpoVT family DNA-binding domain-containing protein [Blastococcus capsensis]